MGRFVRFILISALVSLTVLVGVYNINKIQFRWYVENVKKLYARYAERYAESISVGYFQWTTMYELLKENRLDEARIWLEDLKKHFDFVEEATVLDLSVDELDLFKISSHGEKLLIDFKVFNDDLSEFVKDRAVRVVVNAQDFLEDMGEAQLYISPEGEEFVFGLKYRSNCSALNLRAFILSATAGVATFLLLWMITLWQRLEHESRLRKFSEAMLEITESFLKGEKADKLYQLILQKAIEVVPNAQAGSVEVKRNGKWIFVAAVGYDLEGLKQIEFADQADWFEKSIKNSRDVNELNKRKLDAQTFQKLKEYGRIEEIKCSLVVPVIVEGETIMAFNLENFEREDAFDEKSLELARLFANYLAMVFARMKQEERLLEQQKVLEHLSSRDPLTNLLNRRAFEEYGEKMLSLAKRESKSIALLFMDLNHFKNINDEHGHGLGDRALTLIGSRLSQVLRQSDLLARFGGDEFVALIYDCDKERALTIAERIVQTVEEPIRVEDMKVNVGVSVGIALYPTDAQELDQLIRLADVAMYFAKKRSLKIVFFSDVAAFGGR
ncbi:MAG: GGDEF domain-containing protein [Thermotoga caldifontis]|uniref:sensor domain-containing diguanylate cyclase n=1 Tax=Thermotoga caldifontis TaxID=1508419 RepID=UPI003C7B3AA3